MSKEKVEIELSANSAKLKSEFDQARAKVKKFQTGVSNAVKSVGGLAVGMLGLAGGVRVLNDLREKFDRIGKLANRFEMPVEEVQRLSVAASLSGASLEKLASSLVRGNTAAYDAMNGSKQVADAFRDMGISAEEFAAASPTQKVEMLADAYRNAADKSTAMAAGTKILGRGFAELVPLLKEGGDGIREMTKGLKVLDAGEIAAIEKFNDDLELLKANVQAGIAKEFAGEMENLAPVIISTGQSLADFTNFVVKHHRAIVLLIGAMGVYKGVKLASVMARDIAAVVRTGVALLATKAATDAETAAVARNTAAQVANAAARTAAAGAGGAGATKAVASGAGAAASGAAGAAAVSLGKKAGTTAAGAAVIALAKKAPALGKMIAAGLVGYQIGSKLLGGNKIADSFGALDDAKFEAANLSANAALKLAQQLVTTSKTAEQSASARATITRQIGMLEKANLTLGEGQEKAANKHAIQALRIWERSADTYRIRNQHAQVETQITAETGEQQARQAEVKKLQEEAMIATQKRMAAMKKATEEIRASIAGLKGEIISEQIDLLPPAERVEVFTAQLKKGMEEAAAMVNHAWNTGNGMRKADPNTESLKSLYELAQRAQSEGNDGLAKSLLEQVQALQKVHADIRRAKGEVTGEAGQAAQAELAATRERLQKEKEIADVKRSQQAAKGEIVAQLAILKLEADGQFAKAAALRKELELRREAKEIVEATGDISEADALRLARQRDQLQARADAARAGASGDDGEGRGGRKRSRLYNAQESLQRRLARQSKTDRRPNITQADRLSLGERFVREAEAKKAGPLSAVVKGNDEVPGILKDIRDLDKRLVKIFDKMVKV